MRIYKLKNAFKKNLLNTIYINLYSLYYLKSNLKFFHLEYKRDNKFKISLIFPLYIKVFYFFKRKHFLKYENIEKPFLLNTYTYYINLYTLQSSDLIGL